MHGETANKIIKSKIGICVGILLHSMLEKSVLIIVNIVVIRVSTSSSSALHSSTFDASFSQFATLASTFHSHFSIANASGDEIGFSHFNSTHADIQCRRNSVFASFMVFGLISLRLALEHVKRATIRQLIPIRMRKIAILSHRIRLICWAAGEAVIVRPIVANHIVVDSELVWLSTILKTLSFANRAKHSQHYWSWLCFIR